MWNEDDLVAARFLREAVSKHIANLEMSVRFMFNHTE
jgi:hypothetical protein